MSHDLTPKTDPAKSRLWLATAFFLHGRGVRDFWNPFSVRVHLGGPEPPTLMGGVRNGPGGIPGNAVQILSLLLSIHSKPTFKHSYAFQAYFLAFPLIVGAEK